MKDDGGGVKAEGTSSSNKWMQVLKSRKVWASLLVLCVALGLYLAGQITAEMFIGVVTVAGGIFTGAVAIEDGLSALLRGWQAKEPGQ